MLITNKRGARDGEFSKGGTRIRSPRSRVRPRGRGGSVINNGVGGGGSGLLLLLLDRNPLLPGRQHLIEGVHTHSCLDGLDPLVLLLLSGRRDPVDHVVPLDDSAIGLCFAGFDELPFVYCKIFSSNLGLYSLDASSTLES